MNRRCWGITTVRSNTWKSGRLSPDQMEIIIRSRSGLASSAMFKALVAHHPFLPPPDDPRPALDLTSGDPSW
jgi:hypothetical protein